MDDLAEFIKWRAATSSPPYFRGRPRLTLLLHSELVQCHLIIISNFYTKTSSVFLYNKILPIGSQAAASKFKIKHIM